MFDVGAIDGVHTRPLTHHKDQRGWLVELFRSDELPAENMPQMAYVSETLPNAVRGPHASPRAAFVVDSRLSRLRQIAILYGTT